MGATTELIAIRCESIVYAVALAWTHTVIDDYTLIGVPNAPHWLAGVTSVEGVVHPVVDLNFLSETADPSAAREFRGKRRLLVGGVTGEDGNFGLGLMFDDLPMPFSGEVESTGVRTVPGLLHDAIRGTAILPSGTERAWVLDVGKFYQHLSDLVTH
jgi:hypothetical protein